MCCSKSEARYCLRPAPGTPGTYSPQLPRRAHNGPDGLAGFTLAHSEHGGADRVIECGGSDESFQLAWQCARPNAIVTIVALYNNAQTLPLPDMYGKNLVFKTGGVDGCDCDEILRLIDEGKIDTTPLITHRYPLSEIERPLSSSSSAVTV